MGIVYKGLTWFKRYPGWLGIERLRRHVVDQMCTRISTPWAVLQLKLQGCHIGKGFRVDGRIHFSFTQRGSVRIGTGVHMKSRFGSNLVGLTNPMIFQCMDGGTIVIGDRSGLSSTVLSARTNITIGEDVRIGGNVRVFDHDYHSLDFQFRRDPVKDQSDCRTRPVKIGNDVFIGTNTIILKGVTVGDRAIIGAGSVVSCDIPADEIWAGNPARFMRKIRVS